MATIIEVSDYIIFRCKSEDSTDLSALKHQKLLYYVQAWHLAFHGAAAFKGEFQAWIHGPVNRQIYDLYKDKKFLYSELDLSDMQDRKVGEKLSDEIKQHIDSVLDVYAKYSATELEVMTHREDPWIYARKGYASNQRCERNIDTELMQKYYAARLS